MATRRSGKHAITGVALRITSPARLRLAKSLSSLLRTVPIVGLLLIGSAQARDSALQMVSIDVEGGGGTLFVTPEGKSLLIDSGNPEDSPLTGSHPSSERIVAAAHALGLKKIDYLLTTHYHSDHIGGLEGLLARIPIGTFVDHGENRETTASPMNDVQIDVKNPPPGSSAYRYRQYLGLIGNRRHIAAKAGDVFQIGSMKVTIVMADGKPITKALPGAGSENPACAGLGSMTMIGGEENARSTSAIITFGDAKIAALGDLTWDRENDLFCPNDRIGQVDVYLATHHGTALSGSPAAVHAMAPHVTILGNGPRKGGDPERVKTIQTSSRNKDIWTLHFSTSNAALNTNPEMIANLGTDQEKDKYYALRLRIEKNGKVTVINERNGFNKTYP